MLWLLLLCLYSACGQAAAGEPLAVRSYSPFTQIFGLPDFPRIPLKPDKQWQGGLSFNLVNHADEATNLNESISLDGETYFVEASFRYPINARWSAGIDLPYLQHDSGHLDGLITDWHSFWGISNNNRRGPRNQLLIRYSKQQETPIILDRSTSGLGDTRLWLARTLLSKPANGTRLVTRVTAKLPSGASEDLLGSGAADLSWDIALQKTQLQGFPDVVFSAYVGALVLGKGEILPDQQKRWLPYGGLSAVWLAHPSIDLIAQLQGQGRYFNSRLDELGGNTLQFTVGARYHWRRNNTALAFGLIEDLVSDVTPDFALHLQLRKTL